MKKLILFAGVILIQAIGFAQNYNVTFRVDMSTQSGFTTPEVNGTFNAWCGSCFQMTDPDGDNIWEATTALAAGSYEFKFSADNWATQEFLQAGSACTVTNSGFTNRTLVVSGDAVLPVVCWGSCVDCAQTPNFYDITFRVDMNGTTGFTTPEVNGTFNGWCGNCTAMFDADGDNVWEVTVTLPEGSYEYKYSYDNWGGQESLAAGSSCTITTGQFTNRLLNATSDDTLDVVCFGSCEACGQSAGPYNVTFSVDMSMVSFPFTTPEVNGNFNNWCGNCAAMSDPDGDQIWSITIPLQTGDYTYKFSYDNWSGQEELTVGSACTITEAAFTNRFISVSAPLDLTPVCWSSCDACIIGIQENTSRELNLFPNPANDEFTLDIPQGNWNEVQIFNPTGAVIYRGRGTSQGLKSFDCSAWSSGVYHVVLQGETGNRHVRFIKQ
ncbi:MAG: T9SS type A sorting domain-containing protein [Flavobacteriales bacterium]